MERIKRKSLILTGLLIFAMLFGTLFGLVGCGEKGNSPQPPQGPDESYITFEYTGTQYELQFDGVSYWLYYQENIRFNQSDFHAQVVYINGERENITDHFTFRLLHEGDDFGWETPLELGLYTFEYVYQNGDFYQQENFALEVKSKNLSDATMELEYYTHQYTGAQLRPSAIVRFGEDELVEGDDYTVEYGENVLDQGMVTITGVEPMYSGTTYTTFQITNKIVSQEALDAFAIENIEWTGTDHKAEINSIIYKIATGSTKIEGVANVRGITYKFENVETTDVSAVGDYFVEIELEAEEGYTFQNGPILTKFVQIVAANISNLEVGNLTPVVYNASEHNASEFAEEIEQMDLGITYTLYNYYDDENVDNTNVSANGKTGALRLVGTGNYTGEVIVPFTILPYNVNNEHNIPTQNAEINFVYDGTKKGPENVDLLINMLGNDINLIKDWDYTFTCSNNINAGDEAEINVTFQGNYAGIATYYFSIAKRNVDVSETTFWTGNNFIVSQDYPYTSYQFAYNRTNHANEIEVNKDLTLLENTVTPRTIDQLFSVNLKHYVGTYPEEEIVWTETNDITNASYVQRYYKTVATLTMKDPNHTFTIGGYVRNEIEVSVNVAQAVATYSETTLVDKEYDGIPYVATYTLTSNLGGETPYSLVEGVDYQIDYQDTHGHIDEAIHAGNYSTYIVFANQNYTLGYDNWALGFNITKKHVLTTDTSIITWPTVNRMVWSQYPILQDDGSISLPGVSAENIGTYSFELAYNYGLTPTHISLNAKNFEFGYYDIDNNNAWTPTNYQITTFASIENPFESFTLNEQELNINQIDALTTVNFLDVIEFTLKEGAQLNRIWYMNDSDDYETWTSYTGYDGEVTIVAGMDTKQLKEGSTGEEGDLWIYDFDGQYEGYENRFAVSYNGLGGLRDITINKNLFKTFKFGNTIIKDDNQTVTNWSLFRQLYTQEVNDGDVIAVEFNPAYEDHYAMTLRCGEYPNYSVNTDLDGTTTHTVDTSVTPVGSTFNLILTNLDAHINFTVTITVTNLS